MNLKSEPNFDTLYNLIEEYKSKKENRVNTAVVLTTSTKKVILKSLMTARNKQESFECWNDKTKKRSNLVRNFYYSSGNFVENSIVTLDDIINDLLYNRHTTLMKYTTAIKLDAKSVLSLRVHLGGKDDIGLAFDNEDDIFEYLYNTILRISDSELVHDIFNKKHIIFNRITAIRYCIGLLSINDNELSSSMKRINYPCMMIDKQLDLYELDLEFLNLLTNEIKYF